MQSGLPWWWWSYCLYSTAQYSTVQYSLGCRDGDGHIVSIIITSYYHSCHFSLLGDPRQSSVSTFHKLHYYVVGWSSRTQHCNDTDVTLNYDSWLIRSTHKWQLMDGPTYFLRKEAIKGQQQFHVSVYTTRPLSLQRFFLTVKMFLFCFLTCHCPSIVRCVLVCPWDARRMKERKWRDVAKITFRRNAATFAHFILYNPRVFANLRCAISQKPAAARPRLAHFPC